MKGRTLAVNLALAVGSLLLVALAAEGALRWVLLRNLNPFVPDARVGFRLKESFEGTYPRVRVRTDAHGRRVPLDQEEPASGRWLFLGDSVTFGFGVAAEDAFPWRIGVARGDRAGVTVAAVPGYNLGQSLVLAHENLALRAPERVLFGLVVNDPSGAAAPATYEDIDPHAARRDRGGLLDRSLLVAFVERRLRRITASFEEPAEGAARIGDLAEFDQSLTAEQREAFDRQWAELEQLQAELGAPVWVLICPYRQQVETAAEGDAFQRWAHARCERGPLRCLDPLEMLRAHADEGLFNGDSSYHYNERGHELLTDWLLEAIDW